MAKEKEDWASFHKRLAGFFPKDIENIDWAYQLAKSAHRAQQREGGERYFEHPRAVALILLDEVKVRNPRMIITALLHDSAEDTAIFGNPTQTDYQTWAKLVEDRVSRMFGEEVSKMVIALTKPPGEEHFYLENLKKASTETLLVKMADRLHNLRTLKDVPYKKRLVKIAETRDLYYPIFDNVKQNSPWRT